MFHNIYKMTKKEKREFAKNNKNKIIEDIFTIYNLELKSSNSFELKERIIYSLLLDHGITQLIWYGRSDTFDSIMLDLLEKGTKDSISDFLSIFTDLFFNEFTIYSYLNHIDNAFEIGYDGKYYRRLTQYQSTWKSLQDEELNMRLENSRVSSLGH